MKYIKSYENNYEFYKEGDYVIINSDSNRIKYLGSQWNIFPYYCVKILQTRNDAYYIESFDTKNNENIVVWVNKKDIQRKATPKEIKDYHINKSSNKYNL